LHRAGEVAAPPAARPAVIEQVAHAVARAVGDGPTQVTVRLEPPVLGTVRVTITMTDSGDLSAQLNAATDLGRRILHEGLPRLAAALVERGVDVGRLDVSVGGHDSPARFFDHSQPWQRPDQPSWQAADPAGLPMDIELDEHVPMLSYGHHLIDLLA
jgi:hypothetical protein